MMYKYGRVLFFFTSQTVRPDEDRSGTEQMSY